MLLLSHFNHAQLFATSWTVAHQASLSLGFSRQEYWSGLPCPAPGDRPDPGTEPASLMSPALAGVFFTTCAPGKPFCKPTQRLTTATEWNGLGRLLISTLGSAEGSFKFRAHFSFFFL